MVQVVPLRPEEVPQDFVCAICLSLPTKPWITIRCSHVFCRDCIMDSCGHQQESGRDTTCPVCRCDCAIDDLDELEAENPLAYRIWANIPVKCEHHEEGCGWKGSLSDYESHLQESCPKHDRSKQVEHDKEIIASLEEEVKYLYSEISTLQSRLVDVETDNEDMTRIFRALQEENASLRQKARESTRLFKGSLALEFESLKKLVATTIELPIPNGKGGYGYDRTNVPQLSKLVCQNLADKPASINHNKIFECVKNIYTDLLKNYADNPDNFHINVRMLLSVCLASNWFTHNQHNRLQIMADETVFRSSTS